MTLGARVTADRTENAFTADVRADLLGAVSDAVAKHVSRRAADIDASGEFPEDVRRLFAGIGLLGLAVPERYGGSGAPLDLSVEVISEVAKACANSANVITQQALAASPIVMAGTHEQKSTWLPDLASGEALGAFGLTEPNAGSDNRALRMTARRSGDVYHVSGTKSFCTWGSIAKTLTIFAQAVDDRDGEGMIALVVDLPAEGLTIDRLEEKMGLNGSPTAQLTLDGVVVPAANRLGATGEGLQIAMRALTPGRVEVGALAIGIAEGALEYAGRYLQEREQFGRPLASFQGLQFKIAEHATQIEAARCLLLHAARAIDGRDPTAAYLAAMAKLFATDVAMNVTTDAVGLLGGYGYLKDYPLERMMRDAKVMQIVEGTNEIQRLVIARGWLGGTVGVARDSRRR